MSESNRGKGFIPITGSYTIPLATCTGAVTSFLSQPVPERNNNPDKDGVNGVRNSVLHTRFKPNMLHKKTRHVLIFQVPYLPADEFLNNLEHSRQGVHAYSSKPIFAPKIQ
jgi:epoxyqueuosine reductase QueG